MAANQILIDHDAVREWAEARGARPACVKGTGGRKGRGDVGMLRLDFPGYSGAQSLQPIGWNEWLRQFDDNNLALLVQNARGAKASNFNKLVSRDTAEGSRGGSSKRSADKRTSAAKRSATKRSTTKRGTAKRSSAKGGARSGGSTAAPKSASSRSRRASTGRRTARKSAATSRR